MKRTLYLVLGFIGLGMGALGAVLPFLPTIPFLLLAAYYFAKSSVRMHRWFLQTTLYKKHLATYVQGKGMTMQTKIRVMTMVTGLMALGFIMMFKAPVGRIILVVVWLFHMVYFTVGVKTIRQESAQVTHRHEETGRGDK